MTFLNLSHSFNVRYLILLLLLIISDYIDMIYKIFKEKLAQKLLSNPYLQYKI